MEELGGPAEPRMGALHDPPARYLVRSQLQAMALIRPGDICLAVYPPWRKFLAQMLNYHAWKAKSCVIPISICERQLELLVLVLARSHVAYNSR